jgi:hypothetical protein
MSAIFQMLTRLFRERIARATERHLVTITREHDHASRGRSSALLKRLGAEAGPHAVLGETQRGGTVSIPISFFATAWGLISGGTGSGKSMAAAIIIRTLLEAVETEISFGVLDAKGETFERTLFLVSQLLDLLPPVAAERLRERLVIIDFASIDPLTAYDVAAPWSGADLDYFATSRMETLQELFPAGDGVSLRGTSILKHTLKLLAEQNVPFSYADHILSSGAFRSQLLSGSKDEDLRLYFENHFPAESRATIAAVRARLSATLFSSASLKLALSGGSAPDFRKLMDSGAIVLVNCAGANIPRATARTLQALVLADIRHAVFNREKRSPYLWICDEAQHLFRSKYLREHMVDLLTMARSYSVHGLLITQNMANAVQDSEILEMLHTNAKWALVLRGSPKDAAFLQSALPISGRREKPRPNPYAPAEFYSLSEERNLLLQEIAHLPDREGWLWIKSLSGEALRIKTSTVDIPGDARFQEAVERIRRDPAVGRRQSRTAYLEDAARRASAFQPIGRKQDGPDFLDDLTNFYQADQETNR